MKTGSVLEEVSSTRAQEDPPVIRLIFMLGIMQYPCNCSTVHGFESSGFIINLCVCYCVIISHLYRHRYQAIQSL